MASVLEQYVNTVQNLSSQGMFLYTKDVLARGIIMMIVLF
jgi:sulfur transfer complex TusBCD TusB component (DsrH family)